MTVACGGCLGCRDDRAKTWAMRIVHEAQEHEENCFIILTYDDEYMPRLFSGGPGTLIKKDFQKFMKRLRKRFAPRKIRYYMCGEYGDKNERPHYHACIFGLDFPRDDVFSVGPDHDVYTSKVLAETWGLGFVTVSTLTLDTANYCARYIQKKRTGPLAHDHYLRIDDYGVAYWLEPEYNSMSLKPGIGKNWYEKFKSDVFPSDEVPVPGLGVLKKVPRYYETVLRSEDEIQYEEIKELRRVWREAHGDEYTPERNMAKYKCHKAKEKFRKEIRFVNGREV